MSGVVFLDTTGWLAVVSKRAAHHQSALQAYEDVLRAGGHFVTTALVMTEMHAITVRTRGPGAGLRLLDELRRDPTHDVKYPGPEVYEEAIERWLRRSEGAPMDLTDAVSLEVMRREGIATALATDPIFRTTGFRVIPQPVAEGSPGTRPNHPPEPEPRLWPL